MTEAFILQIILIFFNAIFASAEIAVISMSEAKLRHLTSEGNKKAKKLMILTQQPARFLATIQVAITLAGLLGSAFAADSFAKPLVELLLSSGVPIPRQALNSAAVVLITLILSYFSLIFGELVPKRIAMKKTDDLALGLSGLLYGVSKIFSPVVFFLTISTNAILRLLGIDPNQGEDKITEEEIRMMLVEGTEQGSIPEEEHELIQNVFAFNDITVEDICTHRRDVVWLSTADDDQTWRQTIHDSRYTHYPVCGQTKDDILGILDTKDYFRAPDQTRTVILREAVSEAQFIPETMKANVLFRKMKNSRNYFAVILDEYGGLSGIATIHDLMESLVGNLDEEEPEDIETLSENEWRIQGGAVLSEVARKLKYPLPVEIFDTFSGFVCSVIGRVPKDGESFCCKYKDLNIHALNVEHHVITECIVAMEKKTTDSDSQL